MTDEGPVLGVRAVVVDDDRLLVVRRDGPSPVWGLPGGPVRPHELLAEAVVRLLHEETGVEGFCGPLLGPSEAVEPGAPHEVALAYLVTLLEAEEPVPGVDVAEAVWAPIDAVSELRLEPGLAEMLHDHDIIATFA